MSNDTTSQGYVYDAHTLPRPPGSDIKRFVEGFERLSSFEAETVAIRGYGAFGSDWSRPDPAVIRVLDWLKEISNVAI